MELRRHQKGVHRIAEQNQVSRLKQLLSLRKILFKTADSLSHVKDLKRYFFPAVFLDQQDCLQRNAVLAGRGSVQYQYFHFIIPPGIFRASDRLCYLLSFIREKKQEQAFLSDKREAPQKEGRLNLVYGIC